MKIGILSFRPLRKKASKEALRLRQVALAMGHKLQIFRVDSCQLVYDGRGERVFYNGKKFPKIDVLIPRAGIINNVDLRLAPLKQFQLMHMPVVNEYMPIARAKNKLRTMQILHSLGIPTPRTVALNGLASLNMAIDAVGGAPVILKDPFGSFGRGVVIAETKRAAKSVLGMTNLGFGRSIMIQEYVEESGGRDTRVFVVGDKVIAGMERCAQAEEFRSNVELGGATNAIEVSDKYAKIALASTRALGLEVAGVDIIESKKGPVVLEVNANPGFKALEAVTGIDVATPIIEYAIAKVAGEV
ncbi:RimK family alpha-L-glutamate ligase [Candidatus Peregrinibacteria bacterium]|jgi:ribosomal protein S6--L-glutamate ligase|nr:RimK family alpha-L-glutamate ligase [Candidatus Peregrinibacteria bacterium]MBT4632013.1 RimK family alpha-L-glutamate ligase [Candidatus Peregrinibacteria bacterium]MBT5824100.1 RimK family alpha-L-glutamate ligase [Candidatus Peregrinibacteria bacterium]